LKAERRHELKENVLAKDLVRIRTWMGRHRAWVIGVPVAVLLIVLLTMYALNRRKSAREDEWALYHQLTGPTTKTPAQVREELLALADGTSQEELAAVAYFQAGKMAARELAWRYAKLDEGAREKLEEEATAAFEKITTNYGENRWVTSQAYVLLGLLAESRGEFDKAGEAYQRAAKLWPEGAELAALPAKMQIQQIRDSWPIILPDKAPPPRLSPSWPTTMPTSWPTTLPTSWPTTGPASRPTTAPASRPASRPAA